MTDDLLQQGCQEIGVSKSRLVGQNENFLTRIAFPKTTQFEKVLILVIIGLAEFEVVFGTDNEDEN